MLANRLPWSTIEAALASKFAPESPAPRCETIDGLFGTEVVDGEVGRGGRPRMPIRLLIGLLYLKNSFDLGDEGLVQRWAENVYFQHFCGRAYFEPRLPCDATQIGRFRRAIGEDGMELLLKATIETAVDSGAIKPQEIERVIVDLTVQEKAIAYPTDTRLLEIARHKLVSTAKRLGLGLEQTFAHEGAKLRRRAGGYAHAKQFKGLKKARPRHWAWAAAAAPACGRSRG